MQLSRWVIVTLAIGEKIMKSLYKFAFAVSVMLGQSALAQDQTYTVRPGDSLSRIAETFYGDSGNWLPILNANRDQVRRGGGLIFVGTELRIPDLNDVSVAGSLFEQETPEGNPVLDIVTGNDYAPFTDKDLPEGGMFSEIAKVAFARAGFEPVLEFLPWDYGLRATRKSTFMASFPWFDTEERREDLWYSRPVYDVLIMAFFRNDDEVEFVDIDSLDGKTVCRPEGYFLDDMQAKIDAGLITHVAPDTPEDCFSMLVRSEVDVVSINEITGNGAVSALGFGEQIQPAGKPVAIRSLHIVYPKFHPRTRGIAAQVDAALEEMESDTTVQQIIERHLKLHYAQLLASQ